MGGAAACSGKKVRGAALLAAPLAHNPALWRFSGLCGCPERCWSAEYWASPLERLRYAIGVGGVTNPGITWIRNISASWIR